MNAAIMNGPMWMRGHTCHARPGGPTHRFSHAVDYVWLDPDAPGAGPAFFCRNRFNLAAVHDTDYGFGPPEQRGARWARKAAARMGLSTAPTAPLRLLSAPRLMGLGFNPVSFWLFLNDAGCANAVIAEVNNTFGDRHAYFCHMPGFPALGPTDQPIVQKVFHVSPFQEIAGTYAFNFDFGDDRIAIRIEHRNGECRLVASLAGPLEPMRNTAIVRALLRQPLAPIRTLALIHWHALRLWHRGAPFRARPQPPQQEISR